MPIEWDENRELALKHLMQFGKRKLAKQLLRYAGRRVIVQWAERQRKQEKINERNSVDE